VLRKIYFDNARKLLASSLPTPTLRARRTTRDFVPDGDLGKEIWRTAAPVIIDRLLASGAAKPELSTTVRALWSAEFLYLSYECPYHQIVTFPVGSATGKRFDLAKEGASLWDRDVVEAFIAPDAAAPARYGEFETAPTNERLDLLVDLPRKDFAWASGFQTATRVDRRSHVWTCEMRIPLRALSPTAPSAGTEWRINLYRQEASRHAFLAWHPTLTATAHTPARFGRLEFTE